jgi:REP element-mobilizing transposase RayT
VVSFAQPSSLLFAFVLCTEPKLRHDNFIPTPKLVRIASRGRLPHWLVDNAVYFITFRLRDSIPREIALDLLAERERMLRNCRTSGERAKLDHAFSIRLDTYLDQHSGSCLLREHGALVAAAIKHFDRTRYELHAWCVMPNHVHVMLHVQRGDDVPKIVHSWKSFTAHQIGLGVIWQREYFDRVLRSPQEFSDTQAYIRANPEKAGLGDWPWVG